MADNEPNLKAGTETLNAQTVIESAIRQSCIIDYGIVQEVPANGIVNVSIAVSDTKQNMLCMTCVLAGIASSALSVYVKPNVGDRVLVVYPRVYDENMFTVSSDVSDENNKKVVVTPQAKRYDICGGIAILLNQYKTAGHKNYIKVEDGKVELKLSYDKNKSKNLDELTTTADGDIELKNEKATISVDKNGNVTVDTQGKYKFKNAVTDMKAVIDGLAQELENLTTVGSPATQSTSPASKATITTWRTSKLNQLLD